MKANPKWMIVLILALLVPFPGCSDKDDQTQQAPPVEAESGSQISAKEAQDLPVDAGNIDAAAETTSISEIVSLWNAGERDAATAKFLSVNWQDASILKQIRGLSMSEEELRSLSDDEIKGIVEETMTLLSSVRELFFHVASEAERIAGSEDRAKAEEYLSAIRRYGSSLCESDHLKVVQLHGKAAVGFAEKKLSELK